MKLFKRRSARKIKSEISKITKEINDIKIESPLINDGKLILWNDYNSILKGLEWVLKERDRL